MNKLSALATIGRTLGIIVGILFLLMVIMMITMFCIVKSNNAYKGDYKSVLAAANPSAQKALIVYQPSASGAPTDIANQMAKGLNKAGYEVTLTYPGKHVPDDLSEFSVVAFGSAVYAGNPSEQLTETMRRIKDYKNKTVILYSVGQVPQAPELDVLRKSLNGGKENYAQKFIAKGDVGQTAYDFGYKAGTESVKNAG
jgi:menaquinone-dependent protoporphyrinogen IX oxidase